MLGNIKNLIKEQTAMLESLNIITEDTDFDNLDDAIVLGESDEEIASDIPEEDSKIEDIEEGEDEEVDVPDGDDDLLNSSIDGSDEPAKPDTEQQEDDLLNSEIDSETGDDSTDEDGEDSNDILNMDVDSDIPASIGGQTGEPVQLDIEDILSTEIDLRTNTPKDTLPIPPSGAADAISNNDSILNQRIDSGFENPTPETGNDIDNPVSNDIEEDGDDLLNMDVDSDIPPSESNDSSGVDLGESSLLSEAITIGGDDENNEGGSSDKEGEDSGKENEVTSAVRNKVAEAESGLDDEEDEGFDDIPLEDNDEGDVFNNEGESESSGDKPKNAQDVLDQLSKITKNIEDVKSSIVGSLL